MHPISPLVEKVGGGVKAASLESFTLDFKTEKASFKETASDLAEACVCFANASGGTIVVGVHDKPGGSEALVGTTLDVGRLKAQIYDLTQPHLLVSIVEESIDGRRFLGIDVPEGIEVYSTSQGGFRQRWQTECRPMPPQAVARLSDERRGADWSAGPSSSSLDDVDSAAIERVRELLRLTGDSGRARLAGAPASEIAARLGLVCDGQRLSRAGELLLVNHAPSGPQEFLVYQHRRTPSGEADFSRRWGGPLVLTFAEVLETISARLTITPVTLGNGQQIRIETFLRSRLGRR